MRKLPFIIQHFLCSFKSSKIFQFQELSTNNHFHYYHHFSLFLCLLTSPMDHCRCLPFLPSVILHPQFEFSKGQSTWEAQTRCLCRHFRSSTTITVSSSSINHYAQLPISSSTLRSLTPVSLSNL